MDIRNTPDIAYILGYYGLAHCEAQLTALGVYDFSHINYLTEVDLLQTGITVVDSRVLFSSLAHWNLSAPTSTSVDTNMMWEMNSRSFQKDVEAIEALNACLTEATTKKENKSIPCILAALFHLETFEQITRNAMLAFTATSRGRASCQDSHLRNTFEKAVRAVRDACVWRVQMSVSWGHRDVFIAELVRANGGPMNQDMQAKFLHSHSKSISADFPSAFLSQTQMRRRAPRPPKTDNRGAEVGRSSNDLSGENDNYPDDGSQASIGEDGNYPDGVEPLGRGWLNYIRTTWSRQEEDG
jgi:hypothetical protein